MQRRRSSELSRRPVEDETDHSQWRVGNPASKRDPQSVARGRGAGRPYRRASTFSGYRGQLEEKTGGGVNRGPRRSSTGSPSVGGQGQNPSGTRSDSSVSGGRAGGSVSLSSSSSGGERFSFDNFRSSLSHRPVVEREFALGMTAFLTGDYRRARVHLRSFVRMREAMDQDERKEEPTGEKSVGSSGSGSSGSSVDPSGQLGEARRYLADISLRLGEDDGDDGDGLADIAENPKAGTPAGGGRGRPSRMPSLAVSSTCSDDDSRSGSGGSHSAGANAGAAQSSSARCWPAPPTGSASYASSLSSVSAASASASTSDSSGPHPQEPAPSQSPSTPQRWQQRGLSAVVARLGGRSKSLLDEAAATARELERRQETYASRRPASLQERTRSQRGEAGEVHRAEQRGPGRRSSLPHESMQRSVRGREQQRVASSMGVRGRGASLQPQPQRVREGASDGPPPFRRGDGSVGDSNDSKTIEIGEDKVEQYLDLDYFRRSRDEQKARQRRQHSIGSQPSRSSSREEEEGSGGSSTDGEGVVEGSFGERQWRREGRKGRRSRSPRPMMRRRSSSASLDRLMQTSRELSEIVGAVSDEEDDSKAAEVEEQQSRRCPPAEDEQSISVLETDAVPLSLAGRDDESLRKSSAAFLQSRMHDSEGSTSTTAFDRSYVDHPTPLTAPPTGSGDRLIARPSQPSAEPKRHSWQSFGSYSLPAGTSGQNRHLAGSNKEADIQGRSQQRGDTHTSDILDKHFIDSVLETPSRSSSDNTGKSSGDKRTRAMFEKHFVEQPDGDGDGDDEGSSGSGGGDRNGGPSHPDHGHGHACSWHSLESYSLPAGYDNNYALGSESNSAMEADLGGSDSGLVDDDYAVHKNYVEREEESTCEEKGGRVAVHGRRPSVESHQLRRASTGSEGDRAGNREQQGISGDGDGGGGGDRPTEQIVLEPLAGESPPSFQRSGSHTISDLGESIASYVDELSLVSKQQQQQGQHNTGSKNSSRSTGPSVLSEEESRRLQLSSLESKVAMKDGLACSVSHGHDEASSSWLPRLGSIRELTSQVADSGAGEKEVVFLEVRDDDGDLTDDDGFDSIISALTSADAPSRLLSSSSGEYQRSSSCDEGKDELVFSDPFIEATKRLEAGRPSEAKPFLVASLRERLEAGFGWDHPLVLRGLERLGDIEAALGRMNAADAAYRLVLSGLRRRSARGGDGVVVIEHETDEQRDTDEAPPVAEVRICLKLGDVHRSLGLHGRSLQCYQRAMMLQSDRLEDAEREKEAEEDDCGIVEVVERTVRAHEALAAEAAADGDRDIFHYHTREVLWLRRYLIPRDGKAPSKRVRANDEDELSDEERDIAEIVARIGSVRADANSRFPGESFSYVDEVRQLLERSASTPGQRQYGKVAPVLEAVAAIHKSRREFACALLCYEQILGLMRECGWEDDAEAVANTLFQAGCMCNQLGRHREGIGQFDRALRLRCTLRGEDDDEVRLLHRVIASLSLTIRNYPQALEHYKDYIATCGENQMIDVLNAMGIIFAKIENVEEALACFIRAVQTEFKDPYATSYSKASTSLIRNIEGMFLSPAKAPKSSDLYEQTLDYQDMRSVLINFGVAQLQRRPSKHAKSCLNEVIARLDTDGSMKSIDTPAIVRSMGNMLFRRRRFKEAINFFERYLHQQVLTCGREDDKPDVLANLATAYFKVGMKEKAISISQGALKELERLQGDNCSTDDLASVLCSRAGVIDSKATSALIFQESVTSHGGEEDVTGETLCARHYDGLKLCMNGQLTQALGIFEGVLKRKMADGSEDHLGTIKLYIDISNVHLLKGNMDKSRGAINAAMDLFKGENVPKNHPIFVQLKRLHTLHHQPNAISDSLRLPLAAGA